MERLPTLEPAPLETLKPATSNTPGPVRLRRFLLFLALLVICYSLPIWDWLKLSFTRKDMFSHLPLIPCVSAYLVWSMRSKLSTITGGSHQPGLVLAALGLALLLPLWMAQPPVWWAAPENRLPVLMLSFCLFLWSGGFLILGSNLMRQLTFPAVFLIFMVPFPPAVLDAIETVLQYASAEAAYVFIKLAQIPVFRDHLSFRMPGLSITVAPECSGIRSSLVLFITSLLAGYLFLKTRWRRALLALLVIPLGIVRNGFRILVLSLLCVHVDPDYINSPIHHRGGPIFFVLSLIPFTLILVWLIKSEKRLAQPASVTAKSNHD